MKNVPFQSPEALSNRSNQVLPWKWNSGLNGLTLTPNLTPIRKQSIVLLRSQGSNRCGRDRSGCTPFAFIFSENYLDKIVTNAGERCTAHSMHRSKSFKENLCYSKWRTQKHHIDKLHWKQTINNIRVYIMEQQTGIISTVYWKPLFCHSYRHRSIFIYAIVFTSSNIQIYVYSFLLTTAKAEWKW